MSPSAHASSTAGSIVAVASAALSTIPDVHPIFSWLAVLLSITASAFTIYKLATHK